MARERVLSVTIHDCEVQTFRAGGKGGQNQNKRDTGVRVIHPPSGARGESREERSQTQNKRNAFLRMIRSGDFKMWLNRELMSQEQRRHIEEKYAVHGNVKVEAKEGQRWVNVTEDLK